MKYTRDTRKYPQASMALNVGQSMWGKEVSACHDAVDGTDCRGVTLGNHGAQMIRPMLSSFRLFTLA
jgi:hypothetical protein